VILNKNRLLSARNEGILAIVAGPIEAIDRQSLSPENLHEVHDRTDEILEHIYIDLRFKNDIDRAASRSKSPRKMLRVVYQNDQSTKSAEKSAKR
jgi:hypothetical protein